VAELPEDGGAHDAIIRIASKQVADAVAPSTATSAASTLLLGSIAARTRLAREPIARAFFQLEEAMLIESRARDDASLSRAALAGYRDALTLWPDSLLAARGALSDGALLFSSSKIFSSCLVARLVGDELGFVCFL
jgi:hypothetical protein